MLARKMAVKKMFTGFLVYLGGIFVESGYLLVYRPLPINPLWSLVYVRPSLPSLF